MNTMNQKSMLGEISIMLITTTIGGLVFVVGFFLLAVLTIWNKLVKCAEWCWEN